MAGLFFFFKLQSCQRAELLSISRAARLEKASRLKRQNLSDGHLLVHTSGIRVTFLHSHIYTLTHTLVRSDPCAVTNRINCVRAM